MTMTGAWFDVDMVGATRARSVGRVCSFLLWMEKRQVGVGGEKCGEKPMGGSVGLYRGEAIEEIDRGRAGSGGPTEVLIAGV